MIFCLHLFLEMKKYMAILMMFTAYAILLGHNIIPHHHHNNLEELTEHHNSDHHHESNTHAGEHQTNGHHDDGIGHLFSHFLHLDDAFTLIHTNKINSTFAKHLFSFVSILPNYFSFNDLNIPDCIIIPPPEQIIYLSPHSLFAGLRAPPLS